MIQKGLFRINGISNFHLRNIIDTLNFARSLKLSNPGFLHLNRNIISEKQDNPVTDAKNTVLDPVTMLLSSYYDRKFPLETVELKSFNQKHDKNINKATIHIGPEADYYTRFWNLLAFVVNDDIYFRSNKFNTTTEEGRKLLDHELTHVAQSKNKENKDREELEYEAVQAESMAAEDSDPAEQVTMCGKVYLLRKSQQKKMVRMMADSVIKWVERQKYVLDEQKYLKLLVGYEEMITSLNPIYAVKTEADRWMERELKQELRWRSGI